MLSVNVKTKHHWFSYFQIAHTYYSYFMTDPLNITVYISHICFISTLWLWSTDEYVKFVYFEQNSTFKSTRMNSYVLQIQIVFIWNADCHLISRIERALSGIEYKKKHPDSNISHSPIDAACILDSAALTTPYMNSYNLLFC